MGVPASRSEPKPEPENRSVGQSAFLVRSSYQPEANVIGVMVMTVTRLTEPLQSSCANYCVCKKVMQRIDEVVGAVSNILFESHTALN